MSTHLTTVADYIRERRDEIETALATVLPAPPECPPSVADAMRYSLTAGGKRLRPILCLASAEAVGGRRADAMAAACAIELIHTYSLVHDDLPAMDNDSMRRGRPTLHVVAGEGMAILAGDGLLTEAFALMAREPRTRDPIVTGRKLQVIEIVASAAGANGMVGGQALDLGHAADAAHGAAPAMEADALRTMHAKKTGALIRAAAAAGATLGGGTTEQIQALDRAAAEYGLAFQIVDDILDVQGEPADLGKTPGKDAAAGKPTYPALYGLARSRAMADDCLARAESILRAAGVADSRLLGIGKWIVERSN